MRCRLLAVRLSSSRYQLLRCVVVFLSLTLLPVAAEDARLNVLLIVSYDLAACLGSHGDPVCRTLNLDRLARERVRFERAHCQYPVCGRLRASFMSGLYPHTTKLMGRSDPGPFKVSNSRLVDNPSIGELFRKRGDFSARLSKIFDMGVPIGIERGFADGEEPASWDWASNVMAPGTFSAGRLELLTPKRVYYESNSTRLILPDEHAATQADFMAATQATALLENRAGTRPHDREYNNRPTAGAPFFLAVGFVRPHTPLIAPDRIFKSYPESAIALPAVPVGDLADVSAPAAAVENLGRYGMSEEQQRRALAAYYASVTSMDKQVGRLLGALDRLELGRKTIAIFTSDYGYILGEHHRCQNLSLFEDSVRVPLLISAPGFEQNAGENTTGVVESLIDLYPIIADLVGRRDDAPRNLQGMSLRPLLEHPRRTDWGKRGAYTVTHARGESFRTARSRHNIWGESGEELYDHEKAVRAISPISQQMKSMRRSWLN